MTHFAFFIYEDYGSKSVVRREECLCLGCCWPLPTWHNVKGIFKGPEQNKGQPPQVQSAGKAAAVKDRNNTLLWSV